MNALATALPPAFANIAFFRSRIRATPLETTHWRRFADRAIALGGTGE